MRRNVIAGNWKMFKNKAETNEYFTQLKEQLIAEDRDVMIFPPYTSLETALEMTQGTAIRIGAQNMHFEDSGAYTGEISADMLKELGLDLVLIGHSERRKWQKKMRLFENYKLLKDLAVYQLSALIKQEH